MGMCGRLEYAMFFSLGGSSHPRRSPFFGFFLEMGIFALMFLGNDSVQLHINLYVFGTYVRKKGESVRTRKKKRLKGYVCNTLIKIRKILES
jgi:hypothetical protein